MTSETCKIPGIVDFNPLTQLPRVTVSFSRKVNIGDYQSEDIFLSFSSDVSAGISPEDIQKYCTAQYNNLVKTAEPIIEDILKRNGKAPERVEDPIVKKSTFGKKWGK